MVTGIISSPAHAVRGPRYVVKKGKTPVLTTGEARGLLDSIEVVRKTTREDGAQAEEPALIGLRDRALIGTGKASRLCAEQKLGQPINGNQVIEVLYRCCASSWSTPTIPSRAWACPSASQSARAWAQLRRRGRGATVGCVNSGVSRTGRYDARFDRTDTD